MGIILDASSDSKPNTEDMTEEEIRQIPRRKISEVYIPELELQKLREMYSRSVVQDFNDEFHYSKEEREQLEKEHEKLIKLKNMRNRCPRLSEYVIQWRLCLEIIDEVAETNGVMSPEKFKKDVLKGKIYINGMRFPKYNGKRKKYVNWDYIMEEYILNTSSDPYELDTNFLDSEDLDEEEIEIPDPMIESIIENSKDYSENEIIDLIENGDEDEVATEMSKKQLKLIKKQTPELVRGVANQKKLERKRARARMSIYDTDEDDFEYLRRYDKKHKLGKEGGIPEFKGKISSDDDYDRYMGELEEYDDETTLIKYNGRFYTPDEMREIELKQLLEQHNWNLRKCFVDKEAEKRLRRQKKADKKKEEKIKKMLAEIKRRKESRDEKINGLPQGINAKELKKKKKKGKKKKKDKRVKRFDDILLDASRQEYDTIDEYQKVMEDFSWKGGE